MAHGLCAIKSTSGGDSSINADLNVFSYFRMGLVTGLVDKQPMIAWADREIMRQPVPKLEIIELALSRRRPYSEVIWLLNSFEGEPDHDLALKLLFARAGILLEQDASQARAIVMGLRLLNEEEYLSKELRAQLSDLDRCLGSYERGDLSVDGLGRRLSAFLSDYAAYRHQLYDQILGESGPACP